MEKQEPIYKIVEESQEDPLFSIIEKTAVVTSQFTLAELEANILKNEKLVKGLKGQLELDSAKVHNIEENHPYIKDLTPEQTFTVHMYEESKAVMRGFPEKIAEFEESIAEMKKDKEDIERQIGVAIPAASVAPEGTEPSKAVDL